jgi:lipopolysaccharide transport system permease protein
MLESVGYQFALLRSLVKRDISAKYKASALGKIWALAGPLVLLSIYTLVFSEIFKATWAGEPVHAKTDFAVILFTGLIVFTIFSEATTRATSCVASQPNLVKKVRFPLHLLPLTVVLTSIYHALLSTLVLMVFLFFSSYTLGWHLVILPVMVVPVILLVAGFAFLFAALGVFLRDIEHFVSLLVTALFFVSPVLYPASVFPESYSWLISFNPLGIFIEQIRNLTIFALTPDWGQFAKGCIGALIILSTGVFCFTRSRRGFADVL